MSILYRMPWWELDDPAHRTGLQHQYDREIGAGHLLWNAGGRVIGKHDASDDVLVALADGRYAIVHLTWSSNPGGALWPRATIYDTAAALSDAIARDSADWD